MCKLETGFRVGESKDELLTKGMGWVEHRNIDLVKTEDFICCFKIDQNLNFLTDMREYFYSNFEVKNQHIDFDFTFLAISLKVMKIAKYLNLSFMMSTRKRNSITPSKTSKPVEK